MNWIKHESSYEIYQLVNEKGRMIGTIYETVPKGCWTAYEILTRSFLVGTYTTVETAKAAVEESVANKGAEK